jgi:hypothetical protein
MLKEVKMFTVVCDNCDKDENADAEYSAWSDAQFAEDVAMEADWLKEGAKHYCPECFSYGENDELILKEIKK